MMMELVHISRKGYYYVILTSHMLRPRHFVLAGNSDIHYDNVK